MTIDILAQIFREQLGDAYLDAAVADAKQHDIAALEAFVGALGPEESVACGAAICELRELWPVVAVAASECSPPTLSAVSGFVDGAGRPVALAPSPSSCPVGTIPRPPNRQPTRPQSPAPQVLAQSYLLVVTISLIVACPTSRVYSYQRALAQTWTQRSMMAATAISATTAQIYGFIS